MKGQFIISKLSNDKIKEIHYLYLDKICTQQQISKILHMSKATVSKYLHGSRFDELKKIRRKLTNKNLKSAKKSTCTSTLTNTEVQVNQNSNSLNNVIKNSPKLNSKSAKINSTKSKMTNQIKKRPTENKSEASKPASNPSNNAVNKRVMNCPKLNSSVTSYQPIKTKPSSQAKKLPLRNEAKFTPTSSNASKDTSFMPYLTKKEVQDEKDIEVVTNPREVDYFSLLQFMNIYTDIPHQLFVHKYWKILSKRLVHYYGTRALRKAKRIQNRFKLKMKAREKAKNGAKYIFNKLKSSLKKSNNKKG